MESERECLYGCSLICVRLHVEMEVGQNVSVTATAIFRVSPSFAKLRHVVLDGLIEVLELKSQIIYILFLNTS